MRSSYVRRSEEEEEEEQEKLKKQQLLLHHQIHIIGGRGGYICGEGNVCSSLFPVKSDLVPKPENKLAEYCLGGVYDCDTSDCAADYRCRQ
jgi:hypothetical protein